MHTIIYIYTKYNFCIKLTGGMFSTTRIAKLKFDFSYVISLSLRLDPYVNMDCDAA